MRTRIRSTLKEFREAVEGTLNSKKTLLSVAVFTVLMYILLVLSTFPQYSWQMVGASAFYFDDAVVALTLNLKHTTGVTGLVLVAFYSFLTAVAFTHFGIQLKVQKGVTGLKAVSSLPAFLIGGCVGCGAGILGLLGFFGAVAALPFSGNGVKVLGILLFVYFLADAGDPRTCSVE